VSTFHIKQNDTLPPIEATLTDHDGPMNLEDATVRLLVSGLVNTTKTLTITDVDIIDAGGGQVRHEWADDETDTAGTYRAEWEVTFSSGRKLTFPNDAYDTIVIREELG
jgi:hypothetical protein